MNKLFSSYKKINNTVKIFVWVWVQNFRISKADALISLFVTLILGLLPITMSWTTAKLFDLLIKGYSATETLKIEHDVLIMVSILALLLTVDLILNIISDYYRTKNRLKIDEYFGCLVASKVSSLDISQLENNSIQKLINKVIANSENKVGQYYKDSIDLFMSLITLLSFSISFIFLNPIVFILLIICQIPILIILLESTKILWGVWDAKGDTYNNYELTAELLTNKKDIIEIQYFGIRKYLLDKFTKLSNNFYNQQLITSRKRINRLRLPIFFNEITYSLVLGWMVFKVLVSKNMTIDSFIFYSNAMIRIRASLSESLTHIKMSFSNHLYIEDLIKLLNIKTNLKVPMNPITLPVDIIPNIEFRNVSFKYPSSNKYIFRNFNIKINSGENIAIVGKNGAGKSTFIKLLLRFYDPVDGDIFINGINLKDIEIDSWRKQIGTLFQDFTNYHYPFKENIALGNVDKEANIKEITEASKLAKAHDFITQTSKGYNTYLSTEFKNGTNLSGGQWQRLGLARVFYRNPNVLILDEPTSAIDAEGEAEIFETIAKNFNKKTTIIISHRFSTVRTAEKIFVLSKGEIIEQGTHDSLMSIQKGLYNRMFTLQAKGFK